MNNLFRVLTLCIVTTIFAQAQNLTGEAKASVVKIENVKIEVEVDSIEEIESTFTIEDFEELLNETEKGESLFFKIKCNSDKMSNGLKSSMSYEIKGNTDDIKKFIKDVSDIREKAIKFYKSK